MKNKEVVKRVEKYYRITLGREELIIFPGNWFTGLIWKFINFRLIESGPVFKKK